MENPSSTIQAESEKMKTRDMILSYPLIDSGIYLAVWTNQKFLSPVIYTCKEFDDNRAVEKTKAFFWIAEIVFRKF